MPTTRKNHTLLKSILLLIFLMVVASSASALPMAGDHVTMLNDWDVPYSMEFGDEVYQTFCLEHDNYFNPGTTYLVQSVGDTAYGGGPGYVGVGDPVSDETKWLYAAYFSGVFGEGVSASYVQAAIWYLEQENGGIESNWNYLSKFSFDASDWYVVAVNLTNDGETSDNQSQLVGVRVPEPATLMLLGTGLLGLGLITKRKIQK